MDSKTLCNQETTTIIPEKELSVDDSSHIVLDMRFDMHMYTYLSTRQPRCPSTSQCKRAGHHAQLISAWGTKCHAGSISAQIPVTRIGAVYEVLHFVKLPEEAPSHYLTYVQKIQ